MLKQVKAKTSQPSPASKITGALMGSIRAAKALLLIDEALLINFSNKTFNRFCIGDRYSIAVLSIRRTEGVRIKHEPKKHCSSSAS